MAATSEQSSHGPSRPGRLAVRCLAALLRILEGPYRACRRGTLSVEDPRDEQGLDERSLATGDRPTPLDVARADPPDRNAPPGRLS